ncbi:hypothetical protein Q5P01_016807 [Channa striata]|uniref:Matrix-remodeling-associated protein 7 n=1 Tax=Channa striata TaxID=64152 RepID=A0AA88M8G4_CHASR|nr:hypothetical protein Q5P01_016807 [Channa striata]
MDVDPTVVIPAILFTVVAIYVASSLLSKKPDASSSSSAGNKKPKVGYGDDIPPSRALTRPEPPAPFVEDIGAAERIQDVPDSRVKAVPVSASEPAQEPLVTSEPGPEAVPQPLDGSEKHNEESSPDVITDSTEDAPRTPAPVVEASPLPEVESEEEILHNNDEGAAEDNVMFAPGKKQSTFETLMTKEEMEEEQRAPE